MDSLQGKNVLLTGAAGGIGSAAATRLVARGASLLLTDIESCEPQLQSLAARLAKEGSKIDTFTCDLTAPTGPQDLLDFAKENVGTVDILINNAGIEIPGSYPKYEWQEVERVMAINLIAPMKLTQLFLGGLGAGGAHIVNISSLAGKIGTGYEVPYSTSKFGIYGFTQALRAEYAGTNVRFSAICPIFVLGSGMVSHYQDEMEELKFPRTLGTITAEDVASAIVKAIDDNLAEVVVAKGLIKAFLKFSYIAPRLVERLGLHKEGAKPFREIAEARNKL